ncbi:histidine kinase [uncultured Psychroserpens sp.]|uniref:sensor histidine kinase n=1 Tax=uncultured Psychroserpens sp. TaxID=255436 RepID=UPI00260B4375|nr:histidine kinase [uncultured Psychroserpens sp.]
MKFKIPKHKKPLIRRLYRMVLIVTGIIIIIFNDAFGDDEPFVIFGLFYFLLLFLSIIYWLLKQIKSVIRLKNEKAKTELMHLKSQVNPHFFFNMLNNLYGLVDKDSKKAQELILKLSDMMRYSIYEGQKDTVLLSEEIDYLKNYIELHKMRYHKTIDIQFNVDIDDNDYQIMPLLFIILLENAFKHGVENLRENAYVYITMSAKHKQVHFDIKNNFDSTLENEQEGIGLENLKRRLELVYPKQHDLLISKTNDIFNAQLTISKL